MKELIITTLENANVARIAFSFGPVSVGASGYSAVKEAVRNDDITVVHVPGLGANRGVYRYTHDVFRLGFNSIGGSADKKALVVHESTHAIFDINATDMKVKESEAAAYIAQCQFFYFENEAAIQGGAAPTFANPILRAAWPIAVAAVTTPAIAATALEPLFLAIANDRTYEAEDDIDYDGV